MTKFTPTHIIISLAALIIGLNIVFISLLSASKAATYQPVKASCKKFYVRSNILPDHLFYPVLAATDQLLVRIVPLEEKIKLRADLGQTRLDFARQLLAKDNLALALTTLTKSQKYFNLAAHQAIEQEVHGSTRNYLYSRMKTNIERVEQLTPKFKDSQRAIIDRLNDQNQALLQTLRE